MISSNACGDIKSFKPLALLCLEKFYVDYFLEFIDTEYVMHQELIMQHFYLSTGVVLLYNVFAIIWSANMFNPTVHQYLIECG